MIKKEVGEEGGEYKAHPAYLKKNSRTGNGHVRGCGLPKAEDEMFCEGKTFHPAPLLHKNIQTLSCLFAGEGSQIWQDTF